MDRLVSYTEGSSSAVEGGRRHGSWREVFGADEPSALTSEESQVLEGVLRGQSSKAVALTLGISESTASRRLSNAALKRGFIRTTDMLRALASTRSDSPSTICQAVLSSAERDVLRLVRQGYSNASIAALRGRSERTIANQVSSILAKTGMPSRRVLTMAHFKAGELS